MSSGNDLSQATEAKLINYRGIYLLKNVEELVATNWFASMTSL